MRRTTLGGLDAGSFLRRHWQKRLLLVRRALPHCADFVARETLFALAESDEVPSRLVVRDGRRWRVAHGPFTRRSLARLPRRGWTLLVQGVNEVLPRADALLREFDFIPYARLDDVMVSYAPPGGGVGPHFDSYDVFLLQVSGTRHWQVSRQRDLELLESAPLKLLKHFRAEHAWRLAPGDMLYLPPRIAHDGVAVDECITASVGFRAPSAREFALRFLEFLQEDLALEGDYRDPDMRPARRPARIGNDMLRKVAHTVDRIEWNAKDVLCFLGRYLTEPKAHVVFERPARPLAPAQFFRHATRRGIALALKTQMLFHGPTIFVNGEKHEAGPRAARLLSRLADRRRLAPPLALDDEAAECLYQWYRAGYIRLDN